MSSIDTSGLSQIPAKHASGRDKSPADGGDGKGNGGFADAYATVSSKGAGPAVGHRRIADGERGRQPGEADGTRGANADEGEQAALTIARRDLTIGSGRGSGPGARASGSDDTGDGNTAEGPARGRNSSDDGDVHAEHASEGAQAAGYDDLLAMLARADGAPAGPAVADAMEGSSGAAAAMLPQAVDDPAERAGATARRTDDAAKRPATATGPDQGAAADDVADALAGDVAEADKVFRLARADGKAKPVDMAISGSGEASPAKEQGSGSVKIETVTVLESRRYLGLAQTGNSAAVTAAIAQDPSWAAALTEAADKADATGKVVNTLKLQLRPIDLGTVTATLRLQGDALVVDLKVETGKALRQLSEDQDIIVKALRGHGFSVDQISVQLSSSDRGNPAGQGEASPQFAGQQQAREGDGGRQGGETRQSGTTSEGPAHDHGQADGITDSRQRGGAGGVYL